MKVKSESEVAQSCPTLSDLMDCNLPGSSVHGIFQARVLEWGAISFSMQETSTTPQLKSNNSSPLSLLYGRTLTSIHDYWKNHSLTGGTFIGKVMSLLFNMLSRLVITFLPRSLGRKFNFLLISWLQAPSAVILEPSQRKSAIVSTVPHHLPPPHPFAMK